MKIDLHSLSTRTGAFRHPYCLGVGLALAVSMHPLLAADVTLTATNGVGASSFDSALSWSDGAAPSAANDYFVESGRDLRTPADSPSDLVFAGKSLRLTGARLVYKGSININTITVNDLVLDGGTILNASNSLTPFILAGSVAIAGDSTSTIHSNNAQTTIAATLSGTSGTLHLYANDTVGRSVVLAGSSTYTGNITTVGASGAVLAETGSLTFKVGAAGVNNTISGTGPFVFNGTFQFDLSTAGNTVGDKWTLVSGPAVSYGVDFKISGFTRNFGFWTSANGRYQYHERTGVLTRIAPDTDGDGLPDAWEMLHFGNLNQGPEAGEDKAGVYTNGDFDGDYATNYEEYLAGTNPTLASSFPDEDGDGMSDGWERFFFNGLSRGPNEDADNDYNTNLEEFLAGTDPTDSSSYPDLDMDGMNDGWEVFYFPEIGNPWLISPSADPDGDFFLTYEEFLAGTNPADQTSSPDTDEDGLPDGWELKYFRVGDESLAEAIARQDGSGDPDGDGYSNLVEYLAGTDPTDATSVPGPMAYWRFEEATTGSVPGDGGGGAYNEVVLDSTGNGNAMRTWNDQTAPEYQTDVPFATVPATGEPNTASLYFDAGTDGTWSDVIWTDVQAPLRSMQLESWTIELSFKMHATPTGADQVMFSKDGNPFGNQPPFHVKYLTASGKMEVGLIDGSGTVRYLMGERDISPGKWYSIVITADATTLSLWVKEEGVDEIAILDGQMTIDGAFYNDHVPFNDAWAFGRFRWNGGETNWFKGWIDEARFSPGVLTVEQFLSTAAEGGTETPYQVWAAANIPDVAKRGENDDADGDGTTNLTEFLLGLKPTDGASFFSSSIDGATLKWPAAPGLRFKIQRGTNLVNWDDLATVTTSSSQGTWTDPEPPPGKAFYRVILEE